MIILRENKFATHKYLVERKFESGLLLSGEQVKRIRNGGYELRETLFRIEKNNELFLYNLFPNQQKSRIKLLLNRSEISKIISIMKSRKYHGFVLNLHLNTKNLIKADIGIGLIKKREIRILLKNEVAKKDHLNKVSKMISAFKLIG